MKEKKRDMDDRDDLLNPPRRTEQVQMPRPERPHPKSMGEKMKHRPDSMMPPSHKKDEKVVR